MSETVIVKDFPSPLVNKIIVIKPILRDGALFDKPIGFFKGAAMTLDLPINPVRKCRVNIFKSDEEQTWFEKKLSVPTGTLSTYDRDNKYWNEFLVRIPADGFTLNLANVTDFLSYRVLLANETLIAPSWGQRTDDGRYRFALVESGFEDVEINTKKDRMKKAYIAFGKIEDSADKMIDILNVLGKKIKNKSSVSMDFLKAEINRIIDDPSTIESFISILEDNDFEYRVLIDKALNAKAIYRIDKNGYRLPKGEEAIADDTKEMIDWLKNPKNSIKVETIKAQIEATV